MIAVMVLMIEDRGTTVGSKLLWSAMDSGYSFFFPFPAAFHTGSHSASGVRAVLR